MRIVCFLAATVGALSCRYYPPPLTEALTDPLPAYAQTSFDSGSWQHFLQNLPTVVGEVMEYTGRPIANQSKHVAIVNYDVGQRDLQQCADALIRLRAEYLFARKRYDEIGFHFTSGHFYSLKDYCRGLRPQVSGNRVDFVSRAFCRVTYKALRSYLDIVYAYAGTISLSQKLKPAGGFAVGTVIITPGSPGHCCIIVDEQVSPQGKRVYKLAEGYTPAQSIYILKNPADGSPWHELKEGAPVETASYRFTDYHLRRF